MSGMIAEPSFWVLQALNSLQLAMLLFLLSVGLSVIFGLMNVVNLAHGAFYALGAYACLSVAELTGSFWLGVAAAPAAAAVVGLALHAALIDRLRRLGPMAQVLATFGLLFLIVDLLRFRFGADHLGLSAAPIPGQVDLFGVAYPTYRLFVIAVGVGVYLALLYGLERTPLGAATRAAVDDAETARLLGVDVDRTFLTVFGIGCALAGLAGAVALPIFAAAPSMAVEILAPSLVVVVVGGLGSLRGAFWGALLVGAVQTVGQSLAPTVAGVAVYVLLAAALLWRPEGLVAARGAPSAR